MCTQLMAQLPAVKQRAFPVMIYQTTEKFRDEMNPRLVFFRIFLSFLLFLACIG